MSLQRQDYPPYKHHVYKHKTTHHTSVMSTKTRLPPIQASCLYKHTNYIPCLYKQKTTHHASVMSLQRQDYPPYKRHVFTHTLRTCTPIQASCLYTHTTYHVSTNTRDDPPYKCRASTHTRLPTIQASCVCTQETTHHTSVMCLHTRDYPPYMRHVSTHKTTHHTSVMSLLQGNGVGGGHLQQVNSLLDSIQLPLHVAQLRLKLRRPLELPKLHHHLCKVFLSNKGTKKVSTINAHLKEKSSNCQC